LIDTIRKAAKGKPDLFFDLRSLTSVVRVIYPTIAVMDYKLKEPKQRKEGNDKREKGRHVYSRTISDTETTFIGQLSQTERYLGLGPPFLYSASAQSINRHPTSRSSHSSDSIKVYPQHEISPDHLLYETASDRN